MNGSNLVELPPPLRGAEHGSWAHRSIVERFPQIGGRTLAENDFPPTIRARIEALIDEIPAGPLRPIRDPPAPDQGAWQRFLEPHLGADWLQPPWFLVETYFYRRIIEAIDYYRSAAAVRIDPFQQQKKAGLAGVEQFVEDARRRDTLSDRLLAALWSNQADLSIWPQGEGGPRRPTPAMDRLLVDRRESIARYLGRIAASSPRVDFVLDNAGRELVADLLLAEALLREDDRISLVLHLKPHPTYVSDATIADFEGTLNHLRTSGSPAARELAAALEQARGDDRLQLRTDYFWTSPLPGWRMPDSLAADLSASGLLIFKGDYNYRRLLGDRRWNPTRPFSQTVSYLPAPAAALRSLKSDLVVGLEPDQIERARRRDPDWMTNGRWGLIQFAGPADPGS